MFPNISAELGRHGMTITSLSEQLGVSRKTVSNWLNGKSEIPVSALIKMSQMFECTTDYLIGIGQDKNQCQAS